MPMPMQMFQSPTQQVMVGESDENVRPREARALLELKEWDAMPSPISYRLLLSLEYDTPPATY